MEVEVKLKLKDSNAHHKLVTLLSPFHRHTLLQDNFFFDTSSATLSSARAALRLRFYNTNTRCVLSLKSSPTISASISRVEELEHDIDPFLGRACLADPNLVLDRTGPNKVVERVREIVGPGPNGVGIGLVCLGGFRNVRNVHEWDGMKLEVDETLFEFGTSYEVECECEDPNLARDLIEGFLKRNGIGYSYSTSNKFSVFRSGKLPI